jgi:hypothetical protein
MKTFRQLVSAILICFTGVVPVSAESLAPGLPFSLDEIAGGIETPEGLVQFMQTNLKFANDADLFGMEDYWQAPEQFWELRAGDCEDYALLAHYVLTKLGYESYVVSLYDDQLYAHTIAVFKDEKGFNVINEDRLHEYGSENLEDALTNTYPGWTWGGIAELRESRGWMIKKLHPSN